MEAIMNAITNKPAKINCPVLNIFSLKFCVKILIYYQKNVFCIFKKTIVCKINSTLLKNSTQLIN